MDEIKLSVYKYSIDDILIIYSNGKKDKIPSLNIGAINIEKDFDENFLPILNISASVSIDLYKKISADRNVKASIRINKTAIKAKSEFIDDSPKFQDPIINQIFRLQLNTTDLDPTSEIQRESENKLENKAENNFNTQLDMYFFTDEALESRRGLTSMIFSDTDTMTAIVYLLSELKVKRILLSKPDNTDRQNQIIVPETKLIPMVNNIENIYGVYNHGSVLFYDFDRFYYISKDVENHQARENSEISMVNINFEEFATHVDRKPGSYVDKRNDRYYINSTNYPNFQNLGNFTQEATFNDINYVNTNNGETKNKTINFDNNDKNMVIVDNTYGNNYILNSKIYSMKENYYIVSLLIAEADISHFTPNKRYYMNFNIKEFKKSRKYTGTYRLSKVVHTLSKNGSDKWFEAKTLCIFKKGK